MSPDKDISLVDRIIPSRRAAKVALVNTAEQLGSSPVQSDDEGYNRPRGKGGTKVKYGRKGGKQPSPSKVASASTRLPVSPALRKPKPASISTPATVPRPRPRPKFAERKRPSEATVSDAEDSDIDFVNRTQTPTPRPLTQSRSVASLKTPARPHSSASRPRSFTELVASPFQHEESWNIKSLGTYIWVLVDRRARVFEPDDEEDAEKTVRERIWWPGKVHIFIT